MLRSRRDFLARLGDLALLRLHDQPPDLILVNGHFITVDREYPRAQAVAIARDRFVAVGTNADVQTLASRATKRVDLGGSTVVPGFIDAHTHPSYAGRRHLHYVDCDLRSIPAIQAAIRDRASRTPQGAWVLGFKYDDTKTTERRFLNREDLDAAAPDHPVYVEHRGGQLASSIHSRSHEPGSMRIAPIRLVTRFVRDTASGRLTGRLLERAADVFEALIGWDSHSRDDYREGVKLISAMLARAGVTSAHDAWGSSEDLRAYQDAHESGDLRTRIYCLIAHTHFDRMLAAGVRTGLGDEWVRVGAIKGLCDGSISERTARLSKPYVGHPNDYGILVAGEDELYPVARKAHEAGWQIGIHANGDVAIDIDLRVYERLQREQPRRDPSRHRRLSSRRANVLPYRTQ